MNYHAGKVQAYAQLMAEARARHDDRAIRELEAIGLAAVRFDSEVRGSHALGKPVRAVDAVKLDDALDGSV